MNVDEFDYELPEELIAQEPLDTFRSYFAVYAREQAYCHFSPALIANLERHWKAQERKA